MKIIIIGAGISGLAAGINARLKGYDVEIYEKNPKAGGFCGAYYKKGYLIDHCIHWLIGTDSDSQQYLVWEKLHALNSDIKIIKLPHLVSYYYKGEYIRLSRDYKASWKQWLKFAPEDKKIINNFFSLVEHAINLNFKFAGRTPEESKKCQKQFFKDNLMVTPVIVKTSFISRMNYAKRFKNKVLREIIENAQAGYGNLFSFLFEYACFIQGNADIPEGGSLNFAKRITDYYLEIGGVLHCSTPVKEIILDKNKKISGILLENGQEVKGDIYIVSAPLSYAHETLLKNQFAPLTMKRLFKIEKKVPLPTMTIVAFSMPTSFKLDIPTIISSKPIKVGAHKVTTLNLRSYAYDPIYIKEDKATMCVVIDQNSQDYKAWCSLKKEDYKKAKQKLVIDIYKSIINTFPELKDKLDILDVITPKSLADYCNSPFGAYMSFPMTTSNAFYIHLPKSRFVSNLYYSSQWITSPGGTPMASVNGEWVINTIERDKEKENSLFLLKH